MASILPRIRNSAFARIADRVVGAPLLLLLGAFRQKRPLPNAIARVGIMMFETIGDTLLASSLIASLRASNPRLEIVVFCSKGNVGVLPLIAGIDSAVQVQLMRPVQALAAVRSIPVDVMIDIGQWPRWYAILCALSRSGHTIGFATPGQCRHFAYDSPVPHRGDVHELENFQRLLSPLSGVVPIPPAQALKVVAEPPPGFASKAPYVVVHPWASGFNFAAREWPLDRWIALIQRVCVTGRTVLVTGGPADQERSAELAAYCDSLLVQSIAGILSLPELAAILRRAEAVVSVNTGVMHLSSLLNVPLVALHGPTSRRRWGPIGSRSVALAPPPEVGAEFLNLGFEYPRGALDCMAAISVEEVFAALQVAAGISSEAAPQGFVSD